MDDYTRQSGILPSTRVQFWHILPFKVSQVITLSEHVQMGWEKKQKKCRYKESRVPGATVSPRFKTVLGFVPF